MLDFAGKHNVTAMIEKIPMPYVNTAMERLEKANVKYCFVIDIANTLQDEEQQKLLFLFCLNATLPHEHFLQELFFLQNPTMGCFSERTWVVDFFDCVHALTFGLSSPGAITSAAT